MNPRFKERFPSAVPRLVALHQDDVQLAPGWGGRQPCAASPRQGSPLPAPRGLGRARRGRGGRRIYFAHFRKEAWDLVSHSRK